MKKFDGHNFFLGGQYTAENRNIFVNHFECGAKGLNNPKKSLEIATTELIKVLQKY